MRNQYLSIYYKMTYFLCIGFLALFVFGLIRDGFYLPGSNRNAVVYLLTPTFCYYWQFRKKEGYLKIILIYCVILTTLSRAAFVVLALSFLFEFTIYRPTNLRTWDPIKRLFFFLRLPLVAIIFTVILLLNFLGDRYDPLGHKIEQLDNVVSGRLYFERIDRREPDGRRSALMHQAKEVFYKNPFFGIGFGALLSQYNEQKLDRYYQALPHSLPLTLLAENGIVGTVIIFAIFLLFFKRSLGIDFFKKTNMMTFLIMLGISFGNEYLITAPWFYLWIGLVIIPGSTPKANIKLLDEWYRQNWMRMTSGTNKNPKPGSTRGGALWV